MGIWGGVRPWRYRKCCIFRQEGAKLSIGFFCRKLKDRQYEVIRSCNPIMNGIVDLLHVVRIV